MAERIWVGGEERYLTEDEAKAVKKALAKGHTFVKVGNLTIFFDKEKENG